MVKGVLFLCVIILLSLIISAPEAQAETKAVTLQVFCSIPKYLEFPPPIEKEDLGQANEETDAQINEQTSENFSEEIHSQHTKYQGNQKEVIYTIIGR